MLLTDDFFYIISYSHIPPFAFQLQNYRSPTQRYLYFFSNSLFIVCLFFSSNCHIYSSTYRLFLPPSPLIRFLSILLHFPSLSVSLLLSFISSLSFPRSPIPHLNLFNPSLPPPSLCLFFSSLLHPFFSYSSLSSSPLFSSSLSSSLLFSISCSSSPDEGAGGKHSGGLMNTYNRTRTGKSHLC